VERIHPSAPDVLAYRIFKIKNKKKVVGKLHAKGIGTEYENPNLRFTKHGQPDLKTANQPSITTITPPVPHE